MTGENGPFLHESLSYPLWRLEQLAAKQARRLPDHYNREEAEHWANVYVNTDLVNHVAWTNDKKAYRELYVAAFIHAYFREVN